MKSTCNYFRTLFIGLSDMGKKLYIRNFPSDADEKTLFRQFGKKKVEKVDIIEKKDENGEIISRFCYLYTFLDEQEKLKLYES